MRVPLEERFSAQEPGIVYIPEIGATFCATFAPEDEASARKMAEGKGLTIKPFGFHLKPSSPSPLTWEKVEGWSTWSNQ